MGGDTDEDGLSCRMLGDRLMAGQEPLKLPIKVRILVPERMGRDNHEA